MLQHLLVVAKYAVLFGVLGGVAVWLFTPLDRWKVLLGVAWCLTYIFGFELGAYLFFQFVGRGPPIGS